MAGSLSCVADGSDTPDQTPLERLHDHLDEVSDKPDQMQERLDELGESIESARKQAEADDLLPGDEGYDGGDPVFDEMGSPEGDERRESPLDDADFEAGG